jgi:solute carrier family 25 ornithine transporter 2/15
MPGYFFFFLAYEATREAMAPGARETVGPLGTVAAGAVAGLTLWTLVFPADVVKSRLAVTGARTPLLKMLLTIRRTEGLAALYSGLAPTLLRTVPATGALFLVVEQSRASLHRLLS